MIFIAAQVLVVFLINQGSFKIFLIWSLPPAALIAIGGWFFTYGSLQTKDPDYPEARAAMKKSLWLWLAALVAQFIALAIVIGQAWQRNM